MSAKERKERTDRLPLVATLIALVLALGLAVPALVAQEFTADFDRARCTFTTTGSNPYMPLWPGHSVRLEGEEEDEGEIVDLAVDITTLADTELVDGVLTRVLEEREYEDDELTEVSRNFVAVCRETGDVWYFGEDVDIYEDGVVVSHDGAWRAGIDGAKPGVLMLGTPVDGARYFQEVAPGVAEDRGEVTETGGELEVPGGAFTNTLTILDTNALNPSAPGDIKVYSPGVGLIQDEVMELVEITDPPCQPDATTHCLQNGRFRVTVGWETSAGATGDGQAILAASDSGEFWFFNPSNTELLVKVLNGCPVTGNFWVFAGGLTNVEVEITVTDTATETTRTYTNPAGTPFQPIQDTSAFATCP